MHARPSQRRDEFEIRVGRAPGSEGSAAHDGGRSRTMYNSNEITSPRLHAIGTKQIDETGDALERGVRLAGLGSLSHIEHNAVAEGLVGTLTGSIGRMHATIAFYDRKVGSAETAAGPMRNGRISKALINLTGEPSVTPRVDPAPLLENASPLRRP